MKLHNRLFSKKDSSDNEMESIETYEIIPHQEFQRGIEKYEIPNKEFQSDIVKYVIPDKDIQSVFLAEDILANQEMSDSEDEEIMETMEGDLLRK